MLSRWAKSTFHKLIGEPWPRKNAALQNDPEVIHVGHRAYCRKIDIGGVPHLKKVYTTATPGRHSFANEKLAHREFAGCSWMPAWTSHGMNWYARPYLPAEQRLDNLAGGLSDEQRVELAGQALSIVLDLHSRGYAHRDFHARNLYLDQDRLVLTDFETITRYAERPPFRQAYDITGQGLESPYQTGNIGYDSDARGSLRTVLGVDLAQALDALAALLKRELHEASLTFKNHRYGRHTCKAELIYNTIDLPQLKVAADEAQRDCAKRFARFGITSTALADKQVLDLGSNIGGMLFAAQQLGARECLGVEFDASKVAVATRVAAFADLNHVQFMQANIDQLTVSSARGPHDIVFCLAVNAHVQKPQRLFKTLGKLTGEVLYFEGNANTDEQSVAAALRAAGFSKIEHLGMCDDDALPENNCRPLLRAWK